MNPFDLRGPEFLAFYLGLAVATFLGLLVWERLTARRRADTRMPRDPNLVAGLRDGAPAIVQVAAFSLLAQGVLACSDRRHFELKQGGPVVRMDPVEQAVALALRSGPATLAQLQRDPLVKAAVRAPLAALESAGLLVTEDQRQARLVAALVAGLFLTSVAAIKLVVALQRGRSNVIFLILLAGLFVWGCVAWASRRTRTPEGVRVLADLRALFGSRRARCPSAPSPGASSDLVLLAAVSGIVGEPFVDPAARAGRQQGASSGCGTTFAGGGCSSSCSSGCGGSCGGGCGGCGS